MKQTLFLLLAPLLLQAQTDSLERQINEQVWKPFMQTYNNFQADSFMAVHSQSVIRLGFDAKQAKPSNFEEYAQSSRANWPRQAASGAKRSIELRFAYRLHAPASAYEIGYYKVSSAQADGTTRAFFGRFCVILRKEAGAWKFLLDADTSDASDEQGFLAAKSID